MLSLEYVAGLFDADGCVSIVRARRGNGIRHVLRIEVTNCCAPVIEKLHAQFGGSVIRRELARRKALNAKEYGIRDTFTWIASARIAQRFLEAVIPHLFIKQAEAELGVRLQKSLGGAKLPSDFPSVAAYRDHLASLCSSLKSQRYDSNIRPSVADLSRRRAHSVSG